MNRIIKFTFFLFVAFLLIAAPASTLADKGEDERATLAGSVWILAGQFEVLSIFEVRSDGTVLAGHGGHFGIEKEIKWIGTYRNGQLELRNKQFEEERARGIPSPSETLSARIDGSKMTGHYSLVSPLLHTNDQDDFTGYCVNCFGYGPVIGIVTIGTVIIGGVIVILRGGRKGLKQPGSKRETDAEKDHGNKPDECERWYAQYQSLQGRREGLNEELHQRFEELRKLSEGIRKLQQVLNDLTGDLERAQIEYKRMESGLTKWFWFYTIAGGVLTSGLISHFFMQIFASTGFLASMTQTLALKATALQAVVGYGALRVQGLRAIVFMIRQLVRGMAGNASSLRVGLAGSVTGGLAATFFGNRISSALSSFQAGVKSIEMFKARVDTMLDDQTKEHREKSEEYKKKEEELDKLDQEIKDLTEKLRQKPCPQFAWIK